MLAPNEKVDLSTVKFPLLASTKLDGIRCIFYKGQILSRSLKQIQNKQLREKFEPIRKFTEDTKCILDGEIYSPKLSFQEITHFVMTQDLGDEIIPDHLKFYCFDNINSDLVETPFKARINNAITFCESLPDLCVGLEHWAVYSKEEVEQVFDQVLLKGYEGLILRDPDGKYKFGRGTIKEGLIYKVKPFLDFDGKIIDIIQATKVDENAEKSINELGYSKTSRKKDDRILIEKAAAFLVLFEGKELKVTIAMTDEEKEKVWKNKESYLGKWITYKGMMVGAKDVVRHPVFLRFREPKD